MSLSKLVAVVALATSLTMPASAGALTFTDTFNPPSAQWNNYDGVWTAAGGKYSGRGDTFLPFDFANSNLSVTVTVNALRDDGIWLNSDGTTKNGILLVLGGNGGAGNWAYWHIAQ